MSKDIQGGKILLTADAKGVLEALSLTQKELKRLGTKIQDTSKVTAPLRADIKSAKNAAYQYSRRVKDLTDAKRAGIITTKEFRVAMRESRNILKQTAGAAKYYEKSLKSTNSTMNTIQRSAVALVAAFSVRSLVTDMTDVAQATERWSSRLTVAAGSVSAANAEIGYVRELAKGLSLDMRAAAEGYSQFAASAALAGMNMESVRGTFEGVAAASRALQLDTVKQEQALNALSQMASKGVVSMEELRQQLGEAIPGATTLAAQAMGMTTAEFNKAVESGSVLANDLLPKLGEELKKQFSDIKPGGYVAAMNGLKNAWFEFLETLGNSGAMDLAVGLLNGLTSALTTLTPMVGMISGNFGTLVSVLIGFSAARFLPALFLRMSRAIKTTGRNAITTTARMRSLSAAMSVSSTKAIAKRAATRSLGMAIGALGGPIGIAIGLVASLGAEYLMAGGSASDLSTETGVVASTASASKASVVSLGKDIASLNTMMSAGASEARNMTIELQRLAQTKIAESMAGLKASKASLKALNDRGNPAKTRGSDARYSMSYGFDTNPGVVKKRKELNAEIASYNSSIADLKAQQSELNTMFDNINKAGINVIKKTTYTLKEHNDAVSGAQSALNNLSYQFETNQISQFRFNKMTENTKKELSKIPGALDSLNKKMGSSKSQIDIARSAVSSYRRNVRDLKDQLSAGLITQSKFNDLSKKAKAELQGTSGAAKLLASTVKKTGVAAGGASGKIAGLGNSGKKAAKNVKSLGSAAKSAAKDIKEAAMRELEQFNDELGMLLEQLFPSKKLLHDMQSEVKLLARAIGGDGVKTLKKYGIEAEQLSPKLTSLQKIISGLSNGTISKEDAKKQFDDMKKGIEGIEEKAERTTDVITEQFKRAVESIDSSFAGMWKSVLSGGEVSFKSLADSAKNIMAEVLHGVTTKPLTQAIMDSVTGKVTTDGEDKSKGILNTFNEGFDALGDNFTKGIDSLIGIGKEGNLYTKLMGKAIVGGALGAGIGGAMASAMGAEESSGNISMVSGLAGSLATAAVATWGTGAAAATASSAAVSGTLMGLSATGVGAIVAAVAAIVMTVATKKKDKISRTAMDSRGNVLSSESRDISASATEGIAEQFWNGATAQADKYGVQFADNLAAITTYKTHRKGKGPMMWYFDLVRDGEDIFKTEFKSGDKDPEQVALAMAQMQVAALSTVDWSPVSKTIAHAMTGVDKTMSMEEIDRFNNWLDQTILMEKAYGDLLSGFTESLTGFGGSFSNFLDYTQSVYDMVSRGGGQMVNDMLAMLQNNTDYDWTRTAKSLNAVTYGMELLGQKTMATNYLLAYSANDITKAFGGAEAAMKTYKSIFVATATETHKAGIAYQANKQRIDLLNQSMGFAGDSFIATKEQLAAFVAGLDPLSEGYAENMRWAADTANALLNVADASKYFVNAIEGINDSISGVVTGIREDLMSSEELYNSRKSQAEEVAASIAGMTDVGAIKAAAQEASAIVNNMWRSLSDEQQTAGVGDWMISYLNELETLAQGRIEAIQNEYGADNKEAENYKEVEDAAIQQQAALKEAAAQQQQAAQKQQDASTKMDKAAAMIDKAAAVMSSAANLINKPVDVDVTVHQVESGGDIN